MVVFAVWMKLFDLYQENCRHDAAAHGKASQNTMTYVWGRDAILLFKWDNMTILPLLPLNWVSLEVATECKILHMVISWSLPASPNVMWGWVSRGSELFKLPDWSQQLYYLSHGPLWTSLGWSGFYFTGFQASLMSGKMWGSQDVSVVWLSLNLSKASPSDHLCFFPLWVCKHYHSMLTNMVSYHVKQRRKATSPLKCLISVDDYISFTKVHQRVWWSHGESYSSPGSHRLWRIPSLSTSFLPPSIPLSFLFFSFSSFPSLCLKPKECTSIKTSHSSL